MDDEFASHLARFADVAGRQVVAELAPACAGLCATLIKRTEAGTPVPRAWHHAIGDVLWIPSAKQVADMKLAAGPLHQLVYDLILLVTMLLRVPGMNISIYVRLFRLVTHLATVYSTSRFPTFLRHQRPFLCDPSYILIAVARSASGDEAASLLATLPLMKQFAQDVCDKSDVFHDKLAEYLPLACHKCSPGQLCAALSLLLTSGLTEANVAVVEKLVALRPELADEEELRTLVSSAVLVHDNALSRRLLCILTA